MLVRDVMSAPVLTVRRSQSVVGARALMADRGVHQLVVVDGRRTVVGVIAAADLRDVPDEGQAGDFMPPRLFIVRPDTSIGAAAALMRAHSIGCLPVLDKKRLVGIVTASDLLEIVDAIGDGLSPSEVRH